MVYPCFLIDVLRCCEDAKLLYSCKVRASRLFKALVELVFGCVYSHMHVFKLVLNMRAHKFRADNRKLRVGCVRV